MAGTEVSNAQDDATQPSAQVTRASAVEFKRDLLTLLLSVFTGFGHIYRRSFIKGALLLSLFLVMANGWLLGRVLLSRPVLASWLLFLCPFMTVVIWLFGIIDGYRIGFRRDHVRLRGRRRELLQRSITAYLNNQLEESRRVLLRAIKYDYDWDDAFLLFHIGVIELRIYEQLKRQGDTRGANKKLRAARSAFGRYLSRDPEGAWRSEIVDEYQRYQIKLPRLFQR